jgi:hypothetical protein
VETSLKYKYIRLLLLAAWLPAAAQPATDKWEERRAAEKGKSPYAHRVIEYKPAPGQFINVAHIGTPEAAESITGGIDGFVSLGGFGGYIILGFDHTVWNDPDNPFGVDFTVVGNAFDNSSEPGVVMVMADTNGNGIPDDSQWYELNGSRHHAPATLHRYEMTYANPHQAAHVTWTDNHGQSGELKNIPQHPQEYYPTSQNFPDYPQETVTFIGTRIAMNIDSSHYIMIRPQEYGYADNLPFYASPFPYTPDNPATVGVLEGNGGDAFDISWATDENGQPVQLEGIDFIRIYTGVNVNASVLGEVSTEIRGVIDVSPDDIPGITSAGASQSIVAIEAYPNPADAYITFRTALPMEQLEIYNTAGQLKLDCAPAASLLCVSVADYSPGIYLARIKTARQWKVCKFVVR